MALYVEKNCKVFGKHRTPTRLHLAIHAIAYELWEDPLYRIQVDNYVSTRVHSLHSLQIVLAMMGPTSFSHFAQIRVLNEKKCPWYTH